MRQYDILTSSLRQVKMGNQVCREILHFLTLSTILLNKILVFNL